MAEALRDLGSDHVWVVHGADGLDEISTTGSTFVTEVKDGAIHEFEISPQSYGLDLTTIDTLRGGHPAENAQALLALLDGEHSEYRDIVLLNAGAALMIAGIVQDIPTGLDRAIVSIKTGAARQALQQLVAISNA